MRHDGAATEVQDRSAVSGDDRGAAEEPWTAGIGGVHTLTVRDTGTMQYKKVNPNSVKSACPVRKQQSILIASFCVEKRTNVCLV